METAHAEFTEEEAKLIFDVLRGRAVTNDGVRRRVEGKIYTTIKLLDVEYVDRTY